jgi:Na+/proline symporter
MVRATLIIAFMLASLAFGWRLGIWHGALMARLREHHPDTWQRLGRPHSAAAGWTWTTLSFLFSRRWEHLGDPQFSAEARRFRTGFMLWPIVGVAVALLDGLVLR